MKLKKHDYVMIVICIIGVLITFILLGQCSRKDIVSDIEQNKYKELKDYSRFFTLESCMYKYVVYLQNKDTDSLIKILSHDYVLKNSITSDNVLEHVGYLDGMNTFSLKKVYYEMLDDNIIKYYIYGQILEEQIDGFSTSGIDRYFILYMDTNNMIYSLEPYSETMFSEVMYG